MKTANITSFVVDGKEYVKNEDNGYCFCYTTHGNIRSGCRISKAAFDAAHDRFVQEQVEAAEESETTEELKEIMEEMEKPVKKTTRKKKVQFGGMEIAEDGISVILTEKQVKFIRLLPMTQFWNSGVDSSLWVDVLCDDLATEMGPMTVGAMISTLREKHLLSVAVGQYGENADRKGRKAKYITFTGLGKKVATKVLGL